MRSDDSGLLLCAVHHGQGTTLFKCVLRWRVSFGCILLLVPPSELYALFSCPAVVRRYGCDRLRISKYKVEVGMFISKKCVVGKNIEGCATLCKPWLPDHSVVEKIEALVIPIGNFVHVFTNQLEAPASNMCGRMWLYVQHTAKHHFACLQSAIEGHIARFLRGQKHWHLFFASFLQRIT